MSVVDRGMMAGENWSGRRETYPNSTLTTTNPTMTGSGSILIAVGGRRLTACAMARPQYVWPQISRNNHMCTTEFSSLHGNNVFNHKPFPGVVYWCGNIHSSTLSSATPAHDPARCHNPKCYLRIWMTPIAKLWKPSNSSLFQGLFEPRVY